MTIDIALPFYGDVDFMKQTVASVRNQRDPNWRLIVVDDGYPDSSLPGWFESFNEPRIKYLRNESNLGANGNFQKCLGMLSAEFCLVMGADDLLEPEFISVINQTLKLHPGVSMIHPGVKVIDEHNLELVSRSDKVKASIRNSHKDNKILSGESLATSLMKGNWMYFPSIVWRTEEIQKIGFRKEFNVCQDLGLAMDLVMKGGQMVLIDDEIFRYRRHTGSDSSVKALNGERFDDEKLFFDSMASDLKQMKWNTAARAARMHFTSRMHAASIVPACIANGKNPWKLIKHALT